MTEGAELYSLVYPNRRGIKITDTSSVGLTINARLYSHPESETEKSGFVFYAVDLISSDGGVEDPFTHKSTTVECLVHGIAYFDKLRHLRMGDRETDNECQLYYPDTYALIRLFEELQSLEFKYCVSG